MTKKDYLIKLLTALENDRSIAGGLKIMIEKNLFSPEIIDGLQQIFAASIASINDKRQQEQLQKGLVVLETLKQKELSQKELDQNDVASLDTLLQTL